jgi:phage-related tail fiber protein
MRGSFFGFVSKTPPGIDAAGGGGLGTYIHNNHRPWIAIMGIVEGTCSSGKGVFRRVTDGGMVLQPGNGLPPGSARR